MNLNTIDLTPILQAVIALLAAIITAKLIPWIKSKTTAQQQSALLATVRILVYAAEQLYGAGKGDEKLDYVCNQLRERGYEVNRAEIEATVYAEMKNVLPLQALNAQEIRETAGVAETDADCTEDAEDDADSKPDATDDAEDDADSKSDAAEDADAENMAV